MHSKSEVIKEVFDWLKINLESMESSEFVFNYVHLLFNKCYKINPNRDGSYIDTPDLMKNKKSNNKSHQ